MGIEPNLNRTNRTRTHVEKHTQNSNRTEPINVTNRNRTRTFWPSSGWVRQICRL